MATKQLQKGIVCKVKGWRWRTNTFTLCNTCCFSQTEALHELSSALLSIGKTLSSVFFQKTLQRFCKLPVANTILLGHKGYVEVAWATVTLEEWCNHWMSPTQAAGEAWPVLVVSMERSACSWGLVKLVEPKSFHCPRTSSKRHSQGSLGVRKWPFTKKTFWHFFTAAIMSLRCNSIAEIPCCNTLAAFGNVILCKHESHDHMAKQRKLSKIWPPCTSLNWRTCDVVQRGANVTGLWHNTVFLTLLVIEPRPFTPPAWSDTTVGSAW